MHLPFFAPVYGYDFPSQVWPMLVDIFFLIVEPEQYTMQLSYPSEFKL